MLQRCFRLSFGTVLLLAVIAACGGESKKQPAGSDESNAGTGGDGTGGSSAGTGGSSAGSGGSMAMSGAGGGAGKENLQDESCSKSVTFHVTSPTPAEHCVSGCGLVPQIIAANGDRLSFGDCSTPRCASCAEAGCPAIACLGEPLPPVGADTQWSGYYAARSTCNGDTACNVTRCAAEGAYVARFCTWAPVNGNCPDYSADLKCTEVPFDFPGDSTNPRPIEVVLD